MLFGIDDTVNWIDSQDLQITTNKNNIANNSRPYFPKFKKFYKFRIQSESPQFLILSNKMK